MKQAIDKQIEELLELTDEFIFPAYYSHTEKIMWKIANVYTEYAGETLVLCPLDEGIQSALILAINAIRDRKNDYFNKKNTKQ